MMEAMHRWQFFAARQQFALVLQDYSSTGMYILVIVNDPFKVQNVSNTGIYILEFSTSYKWFNGARWLQTCHGPCLKAMEENKLHQASLLGGLSKHFLAWNYLEKRVLSTQNHAGSTDFACKRCSNRYSVQNVSFPGCSK